MENIARLNCARCTAHLVFVVPVQCSTIACSLCGHVHVLITHGPGVVAQEIPQSILTPIEIAFHLAEIDRRLDSLDHDRNDRINARGLRG